MRNIVSAVQAIRRRIQQEHPFDFTQVDKVRLEHKKIMETVQMEDFLPGEQMGNIAQLMEKATGIVAEFRRDTADLNSANQDLERSKFNGEIVIVATGCSSSQNEVITEAVASLGGSFVKKFNADVSHVVTLGNEQRKAKRTMKFLKAVAAQKYVVDYRCKVSNLTIRLDLNDVFIVDFSGIKSSLQQGRWISEAPFEIRGDLSLGRFPIFKDRLRYRIFDGLNLLFYGSIDFPHPTKQELKDLVRLGGGNPIEYEILSDPKSPPCVENSDYIRNVENGGHVSGSVCIVSPDITDSCLQDVYGSFAINQNPHLFCVSLVWLIDSISVYRIVNPKLYRILPPN